LGSKVWTKRLCLLATNITKYFGCDCMTYFFHVQKVLPSRMLLLEGWNGQRWMDHVHNCAQFHLPNVDGKINPSLVVVFIDLWCMLCKQFLGATTMLICDQCS
jgi:hypothetical protein